MSDAMETMPRWKVWLLATRPATLTAALSPVLVGAAVAYHVGGRAGMNVLALLAAAFGAIFIQIGTNLANDVFDYEKGADTAERLGPLRVTQAGLLKPATVRAGMVVSFLLATACGVYLLASAGWPIVVIGLASIASGIAYTGGPYPLGYNGLGDVFVFVFFGLVAVCGTVFVTLGSVPALAWWMAVPVGALSTAVLVVNNTRDHETDVKAGKRTLVVRHGRAFGVAEYAACWVVATAVPLGAAVVTRQAAWLLPVALVVSGYGLVKKVATTTGKALNPLLAATAQRLLVHSVLTAVALVLTRR